MLDLQTPCGTADQGVSLFLGAIVARRRSHADTPIRTWSARAGPALPTSTAERSTPAPARDERTRASARVLSSDSDRRDPQILIVLVLWNGMVQWTYLFPTSWTAPPMVAEKLPEPETVRLDE